MARIIGRACKIMRREGTDLGLKSGVRSIDSKCKIDTAPGMHGAKKGRSSDYGVQMRQKQLLKRVYGILERQFRNYYKLASKRKAATGEVLLQLLESRLDNVVYRMGFASTRPEARQLVTHRTVLVNGKIVNIPSYRVSPGDIIEIREKARGQGRIQAALSLAQQRSQPDWLDVDTTKLSGVFKEIPERSKLPPEYNEQLVVELYSK